MFVLSGGAVDEFSAAETCCPPIAFSIIVTGTAASKAQRSRTLQRIFGNQLPKFGYDRDVDRGVGQCNDAVQGLRQKCQEALDNGVDKIQQCLGHVFSQLNDVGYAVFDKVIRVGNQQLEVGASAFRCPAAAF